jgi:3-phosphoshikimate 1-carboxyvinyltransferase
MRLRVRPCQLLHGTTTVPGDKSISHRALLLGAIAQGISTVRNWLPAADCRATLNAVRALGVVVEQLSPTELLVHGVGLHGLSSPSTPIDCQGSGTTMRLLAGLLAGQPFTSTLDGHAGLRRRPMERVAVPLREMGAKVETRQGCPPLTIAGGRLRGIDYYLPVASAQVKSAILLAGLYARGQTIVRQPGPARDHTERMLKAQGVDLQGQDNVITLFPGPPRPAAPPRARRERGRGPGSRDGQPLAPCSLTIPADFSSAAFPLVAALLVPKSNLVLEGVGINPTRTGLLDVLRRMGAEIVLLNVSESGGEPVADLMLRSSRLQGVEVGGQTVVRMIDEFPIFTVAATQAQGETLVRDARELRVKETDRIAAIVAELQALGASIEERDDGFIVQGPTRLRGALVQSHGDHRLAMAMIVAGLVADGETVVEGTDVIADSFPGFVELMRGLGAEIEVTAQPPGGLAGSYRLSSR